MKACRLSAVGVLAAMLVAWQFVGAEVLVPTGVLAWLVVVYLVLCNRHGLGEANRLIRSIGSLVQGGGGVPLP